MANKSCPHGWSVIITINPSFPRSADWLALASTRRSNFGIEFTFQATLTFGRLQAQPRLSGTQHEVFGSDGCNNARVKMELRYDATSEGHRSRGYVQGRRAQEGKDDDSIARYEAALPEAKSGGKKAGVRSKCFTHEVMPEVTARQALVSASEAREEWRWIEEHTNSNASASTRPSGFRIVAASTLVHRRRVRHRRAKPRYTVPARHSILRVGRQG